jgi:AraC-like DNA-binding protein
MYIKEFEYKKMGYIDITPIEPEEPFHKVLNEFIKMVFLNKGSVIYIDFKKYELAEDAIFFINPGQWFSIEVRVSTGFILFYNRDFYCIEIHDAEVACDGILYNNVYAIPTITLERELSTLFKNIFLEIKNELRANNHVMEEMLRILLKQLIIRSTRIWIKDNPKHVSDDHTGFEFIRKFSRLVEQNYKTLHAVSDYARLLNMTPKVLHKRLTNGSYPGPNDIIKTRIILESKRLLVHTDLSVKEISYILGYQDPPYFTRFFSNITTYTPQAFRKKYK